jgi:hypothetical protein
MVNTLMWVKTILIHAIGYMRFGIRPLHESFGPNILISDVAVRESYILIYSRISYLLWFADQINILHEIREIIKQKFFYDI